MTQINTKYGVLKNVGNITLHENGFLKDCVIYEKVEFNTPCGILIPQYEFTSHRNKTGYSASFYKNGVLRKISLSDITPIITPLGEMPAELITFYESGKIKRVFPLNGQLTAYWEENDEYQLAQDTSFKMPFGEFKAKIIAISFYENEEMKDFTFWPKEVVKIVTPIGETAIRIGISLYSDGSIKSVEPAYQQNVQTPIGMLKAYDLNASGISGDINSLNFTQEGRLKSLITSTNKVTVSSEDNKMCTFSPKQTMDEDGLEVVFLPLKLTFEENIVIFNDSTSYDLDKAQFVIEPYVRKARSLCSDCSSCGQNCGANN
jgi:antitoxin component YwqK of YwqJK toxin-antitoxin module